MNQKNLNDSLRVMESAILQNNYTHKFSLFRNVEEVELDFDAEMEDSGENEGRFQVRRMLP